MHSKNQSQTITPNRVRDAAIQIISTNAINTEHASHAHIIENYLSRKDKCTLLNA
jgi:hypothetical protein